MGRTSDARDRLIESGQGLMHERGFTAVGVSEVCAHAGVNKGSFYHFFPSKQELALAVIARYAEEADRMFEAATILPSHGAVTNRDFAVLRSSNVRVFEGYAGVYEKLLSEALDRGDLPAIDTRRAAFSLLALQEGRVMLAKLNDDPELLRGLGDEALRLLGAEKI
jgi:TetR/AcrR family transcriptional repressor of nem operon